MAEKGAEYSKSTPRIYFGGGRYVIQSENHILPVEGIVTTDLICAAVNACISINKDNPQAVADKTQLAFETLEWVYNTFDGHDDLFLPLAIIELIKEVLSAKITGGKHGS